MGEPFLGNTLIMRSRFCKGVLSFVDKPVASDYCTGMGTHLGRTHRGHFVHTACGKLIDKRAVALAKKKTGRVPYVDVHDTGAMAAWLVAAIKDICPACLANSAGVSMLSEACRRRLRRVKEIHIEETTTSEAVTMCCTKMWAMESLFVNDIGFMTVGELAPYLADDRSPNAKLCSVCLEHPKVQLRMLADVEL